MPIFLITGGSGFLGSNLTMYIKRHHKTYITSFTNPVNDKDCISIKIDIRNKAMVENLVKKIHPDIIIHTVASTNLEFCEEHPQEAEKLNVESTRNIAEICKNMELKLIYISTDSIFNGKVGNYTEQNKTSPINVYAKTKLDAENAVKNLLDDYLIIRTNFYGWNYQNKHSLAEWILFSLLKKQPFKLFTDVIFTPLLINNLAEILFDLISKKLVGTFNLAGPEAISKHDFAIKIVEIFDIENPNIIPISVDDFNFKALRPKNTSLNIDKLKKHTSKKILDIKEGITLFKDLLFSKYVNKLKGYNFLEAFRAIANEN